MAYHFRPYSDSFDEYPRKLVYTKTEDTIYINQSRWFCLYMADYEKSS